MLVGAGAVRVIAMEPACPLVAIDVEFGASVVVSDEGLAPDVIATGVGQASVVVTAMDMLGVGVAVTMVVGAGAASDELSAAALPVVARLVAACASVVDNVGAAELEAMLVGAGAASVSRSDAASKVIVVATALGTWSPRLRVGAGVAAMTPTGAGQASAELSAGA